MTPKWTPAQQLAIDLHGQDLLISAAAGSGKTATLTERIIRELTGRVKDQNGDLMPPADISRMLIVTFTRAAAAELRSRISRALSAAIAEQPGNRRLYSQLVALGSADICTIDAFYLQPVRANFERLGLPSSFRLADEQELRPIKTDTLQKLLDQYYMQHVPADADPTVPLSVLQGNAFARTMDDLMPNRDRGETVDVLLKLYEKLLAFPEGVEALNTAATRLFEQSDLPFARSDMGRALTAHIIERLESLVARYEDICAVFSADPAATSLYLGAAQSDLEVVRHTLLCLQSDDWDAAGEALQTFKPVRIGSSRKLSPSAQAMACKARRSAYVKEIRALAPFFADDAATRSEHMRQSATTEQMLYHLLSDYDQAIREIKLRRGIQDFTDVRRAVLSLLLDEAGMPTDIARSLQLRYDAVYIDEYQDVDTVQDTIFSIIGSKGNRFMVGDIKQSIYSFRGAEPSIFADYRRQFDTVSPKNPASAGTGACLFMSENFRCDPEVIAFTNAVCSYTFEVCADSLSYRRDDDLICKKVVPSDAPAHPVNILLLEKNADTDEEEDEEDEKAEDTPPTASKRTGKINPEAVAIAQEIDRLLREECLDDGSPIRASDVAVLMRAANMADDLTRALAAYGIETTHQAATSLASHPDMTELIDLLSVIDNPRDDVPLTALLSAEASPISFEELLRLRTAAPECANIPVFDVLCMAAEGQAPLDCVERSLQERCGRLVAFIHRWQALARALPADKLLRKLYFEPSLQEKASSPVYLAVYDHARKHQSSAFCGLYQFLRYFRPLLADPRALSSSGVSESERDAVTILTIHKSKGLEFPVVFVADCNAKFNTRDLQAPVIFDHTLGAAARVYLPETSSRHESVVRLAIAEQLRLRQTEEEMRILYVALTRARERLYLTAKLQGTAASALDHAARRARGDRAAILSAKRYLDWVLAALSPENRDPDLPACYAVTVLDRADYGADRLPSARQVEPRAPRNTTAESHDDTVKPKPGSPAFYHDIVQAHTAYHDSHALLRSLPTKAAASKLTHDLLDRHFLPESYATEEQTPVAVLTPEQKHMDEQEHIRHRLELMRGARESFAALLDAKGKANAAERGTATHLFLQYCDHRLLSLHGVDAEITRLVQEKYLTTHTADILNRHHLSTFVKSDLFAHILSARHVHRELQFNRFLPYRTFTTRADVAEQLGDACLYVQGSLDLLLEHSDGSLTLCDYKTDRLRTEGWGKDLPQAQRRDAIRQQLVLDHGEQLRIYADAVLGMFGKYPDKILIYSLPLGTEVDMTDLILCPDPLRAK